MCISLVSVCLGILLFRQRDELVRYVTLSSSSSSSHLPLCNLLSTSFLCVFHHSALLGVVSFLFVFILNKSSTAKGKRRLVEFPFLSVSSLEVCYYV